MGLKIKVLPDSDTVRLGDLVSKNEPLSIDYALDIFQDKTFFAPMLWLEGRGMRDIKPGEIVPPGTVLTGWIDEETFIEHLMCDGMDEAFMKDWMLFIRKPTYEEYQQLQWE